MSWFLLTTQQQAKRNTFSHPVCRGMKDPPVVPKTSYCHQDSSYPRQIQCFGRIGYWLSTNSQNRMGIGSIDTEFSFKMLSHSIWICLRHVSVTNFRLCIPSSGQSSLCDRCIFHELEQYSCLCISYNILIPSVLNKICQSQCRIVLIAPLWTQQYFSEVLLLLSSS